MPEPENGEQEQSPQELQKQADAALQRGDIHLAMRLAEQGGDIMRAYVLSIRAGELYGELSDADRLAAVHNIAGHEYKTVAPPIPDADYNERMRIALESRLRDGATASELGFHGFSGKSVVDAGTRDGRFVPLFRRLGADDVYGVDPETSELDKAVEAGILDRDHAIPTTIEDIPPNLKGTFDVATIFNFNIPMPLREAFMKSVSEALSPTGEVVMTVGEGKDASAVLPVARRHFDDVQSTRLWSGTEDSPHAYLIVGHKKEARGSKAAHLGH